MNSWLRKVPYEDVLMSASVAQPVHARSRIVLEPRVWVRRGTLLRMCARTRQTGQKKSAPSTLPVLIEKRLADF